MMRPRVKGALLLLLAFGLGAAAGALGLGLYQARTGWWRPPHDEAQFRRVVLKRLTSELGLRADQQQQVEGALQEAGLEFSRLRDEIGPRFHEIRARSRDRIRGLLDPEQQAKFDALAKEWERRAERWHGRPPGPEAPGRKAP
jgi:hypothetical protein